MYIPDSVIQSLKEKFPKDIFELSVTKKSMLVNGNVVVLQDFKDGAIESFTKHGDLFKAEVLTKIVSQISKFLGTTPVEASTTVVEAPKVEAPKEEKATPIETPVEISEDVSAEDSEE